MRESFHLWAMGVAAAAAFVAVACTGEDPTASTQPADGGTNETGSSDAGTGGESGPADSAQDGGGLAPDAAPAIACPTDCLPPAPDGWTGPSAVYDGPGKDAPSQCPEDYTIMGIPLALRGAIEAGPPSCSCGAPVGPNAKCSVTLSSNRYGDCLSVEKADVTYDVSGPLCVVPALPSTAPVNGVTVKSATFSGSCTYPSVTKTGAPPAKFEQAAVACRLPVSSSCPGRPADCVGAPIPKGSYSRLCIYKMGDELCPSGNYPVRFTANTKVVDDRACTGCVGTATGSCGSTFGAFSSNDCSGSSTPVTIGTCSSTAGSVALAGLGPVGSSCPSGTPETSGTVTTTDPVTFCCTL